MAQAILLSTAGVILTAGLVGGFVYLVLKRPIWKASSSDLSSPPRTLPLSLAFSDPKI